ncbi:MAG: hypothetical protein H6686_06695 [Fibrobacteria bacterium]|nr:hypothetical protein [Fibrobacteria bacterium]
MSTAGRCRIIGFCAVETRVPQARQAAVLGSLERLARRWNLESSTLEHPGWRLHLLHEGRILPSDGSMSFLVGPLLPCPEPDRDRHLVLELTSRGLTTSTDFTGSVPVFHSSRDGWVVSNLEPAVIQGSGTDRSDLSLPGLFGLLLFSHFLWDETLWGHIAQQIPDSSMDFPTGGSHPVVRRMDRWDPSPIRKHLGLEKIAAELDELNTELVQAALSPHGEVILPLSGGYDSRMILVAAARDSNLRDKLRCFTYGPSASLEVQAARRLAKAYRVSWEHVDLPCRFLERRHLEAVGEIFGSSLHFHGMYQLEFLEMLSDKLGFGDSTVLTSGYMTGVPAGQHVSLMLDGGNPDLVSMFTRFGQSRRWSPASLSEEVRGLTPEMVGILEAHLEKAFHFVDADPIRRSIVCDVLTRQRNFISYYPRTVEWAIPHVAPHHHPKYANFFLSLDDTALRDRLAVEEMFVRHHPRAARVFSNSNGLRSIGSNFHARLFAIAAWMRRNGLRPLIPPAWKNQPLALDQAAIARSGLDGFWPLPESIEKGGLSTLIPAGLAKGWFDRALEGDVGAYDRLVRLQAAAWGLESLQA